MRRLRRFVLTAFVLDALLGVGALLVVSSAPEVSAAPPGVVDYVPTDAGCAVFYTVAEGVWRYGGFASEHACASAGSERAS